MRSRSHHSLEEDKEEKEEEGDWKLLDTDEPLMFIVIYPHFRGAGCLFFSPRPLLPSPLVPRRERERERERERYTTPAGKYELLNLDKGSRLNDVQGEGRRTCNKDNRTQSLGSL